MKKTSKRIWSALLIAILVFTSTGMVFADSGVGEVRAAALSTVEENTGTVQLDSAKDSVVSAVEEAQISLGQKRISSSGSFDLVKFVTGSEVVEPATICYGASDPTLTGDYNRGVASEPISLSKGTVMMAVRAASDGTSSTGSVYYGVYKDAALTDPVDSYGYVSADGTTVSERVFQIPASGTYYLGVYSKFYNLDGYPQNYAVLVSAAYASGANRTLTNAKKIAVGQKSAQVNYFKFKAVNTGYIKVQCYDNVKVALCNSSKKALTGYTYANYTPTYGVKKGTTYYFKVSAGSNSDGGYTFKINNNAISENSGTTKAKAVTLKTKTTKKGTITAGSSQADWYKLTLPSTKTLTIIMNGSTNDTLKIAVYKGSSAIKTSSFYYTNSKLTLTSYGKFSKGTYYIKVYRGNSKSSGWYSLYWK